MTQLAAAIDIGSNTFRMLIAKPSNKNMDTSWQTVFYCHRIIRLGEGLHQSGILCDAAMQRALLAFKEFADVLKQHHITPQQTLAVATAAIREASNGEAFCHQVKQQTGIDIQIIQGDEEANMSLAGATAVLSKTTRKDMLLFDIGGASTEFIRAKHTQTMDSMSCKLGVVRLCEAHLHSDPPSNTDYQAIIEASKKHLQHVNQYWQHSKAPKHLVGTAGTVTTLAAIELDLCPYDSDIINNHSISKSTLLTLRDRLLAMTHQQRQSIRTIEAGRADLIIAGLAIVEAIMDYWNYENLIVVDAGLLEGAWLRKTQELYAS